MSLKDLSREEAIVLLGRIAKELEVTESAIDFCLWLDDLLKKECGVIVGSNSGGISMEEFREHMFQANLPDSDPRKRD